jgi:hypothetical protein
LSRIAVVFPLTPGAAAEARALLAHGPPWDPEGTGLERCHVFVAGEEAIFVFEAEQDAADSLVADLSRKVVAEWSDLLAGPPRLAKDAFSWVRPSTPENVAYEPTPGPGDSDGGDVYEP